MIKKRERETSLEEIDDTEWDECNEDETYIDSITLTEEEEEDNKKPDSTIRILFFLIYYDYTDLLVCV